MNDKFIVYAADIPIPPGRKLDDKKHIGCAFDTLAEALKMSFERIDKGLVVSKIEGPNGLLIEKDEIGRRWREAR